MRCARTPIPSTQAVPTNEFARIQQELVNKFAPHHRAGAARICDPAQRGAGIPASDCTHIDDVNTDCCSHREVRKTRKIVLQQPIHWPSGPFIVYSSDEFSDELCYPQTGSPCCLFTSCGSSRSSGVAPCLRAGLSASAQRRVVLSTPSPFLSMRPTSDQSLEQWSCNSRSTAERL